MNISEWTRFSNSSAYSRFTLEDQKDNLDMLEAFGIPLRAGSVQVLIYDENKELVFEGFDIARDGIGDSFLLLDDLNLPLDAGDYWIVLNQPSAYTSQLLENREPEVPNTVDSPSTSVLLLLALILMLYFGRKK